ncbi:hypothetical protein Kpol_479p7 [Vanderwaltozyma polyspora DSM 70294]|uniref:Metacaspase-1 n=1 Tax=Vanderwaltozyma polyspora (strain ATCC 22028 / DSM 70294 / BCRC 21397 / CBS 2163 / NBRC 10782 / NRRL Y-8283 / UCD 57-17) TaxID=436907 RepID=A7TQC0_VANPO|nr:uncharacterized protein Kpol_479p7 [Vanderwaltozyma polyspora DSM 70294]EDO15519.1 hypothetical protein Kpol_479p7 [Vanderwaltozyma polyspora DSM 70294]
MSNYGQTGYDNGYSRPSNPPPQRGGYDRQDQSQYGYGQGQPQYERPGENRDGYGNRQESDYGRQNDDYGRRQESSYGRQNDDYGRTEDSSVGRKKDGYGRRDESSYGRQESGYGRKNDSDYSRTEDSSYGRHESGYGRQESTYGKQDNDYSIKSEYGRQDNDYNKKSDYGRKQESSYGRQDNGYGDQSSYGRKDDSYNKQQSNYGRDDDSYSNKSKYNRKENEYDNNQGSYGSNVNNGRQSDDYGRKSDNYNNSNSNSTGQGGYERPSQPPQQKYQRPTQPPPSNSNNGYGQQQQTQQQPPSQNQQYGGSRPPRRKALLIGINYIGSKHQLRGCINDVANIYAFLTQRYGYNPDDIVRLTDDQKNMACIPTRANMIRGMQWLVKDARPGDSLFFHYSGHGGQTEDLDGDEENGFDETIMPVDFETQGVIIDDVMNEIMVQPLQQGVKMIALFDSCYSGSVLDLPYTYSTKGLIKEPNSWKEAGSGGLQAAMAYASGDRQTMMQSLGTLASSFSSGLKGPDREKREMNKQVKSSPADIIMFSGSKDNQTSADAIENGFATGAMSYAFIKVLSAQPQQSYLTMLQSMRQEMYEKYSQKPQLSSSHPIDVSQQFVIQ